MPVRETSTDLFSRPILYCISDTANGDPAGLFRSVARCSVALFQFRHKHLPEEERRRLVAGVAALPRQQTRLLINQSIGLVRETGADGVHLPAISVSVATARRELGGKLVGVSVHSLTEALEAAESGADYLLLAPVFSPLSKSSGREPLGLESLRQICNAVSTPVVALGGMTPEKFVQVLATGAAGIAGISLFADPARVEEVVARFHWVKK